MCLLSRVERFPLIGGFNVLISMGERLGPGIMSAIIIEVICYWESPLIECKYCEHMYTVHTCTYTCRYIYVQYTMYMYTYVCLYSGTSHVRTCMYAVHTYILALLMDKFTRTYSTCQKNV